MTAACGEPKTPRALVAFTELVRDGVEPRTASDLDEGLEGVYARMDEARARRRGLVRWSLLGATATLCALVGLKVASDFRERLPAAKPPALAYVVEGGSVLEGGYLRESGLAGVKLSFNEGSRVVLLPGTRGRLRAVDKEGARVGIEHGTASFHVTQGGGRRWSVEAGPFLVTVKGTVFWLSWDSSSERFDLRLRHGRVVVSGPISGGDIALRAGQRLVVSLPRAETLITEEDPEAIPEATIDKPAGAPAVRPPAPRPPVVSDKPAGPKPSAAPAPSAVAKIEGERRWADELASGHWDRILEEVERTGVESALDKTSSEDLFALANAARYRRRTDLARAALLAQRRRFPGSPRALDSIFLLGRVEEARARGMDRAIAWYDEYLTRTPTGAYAAEALGRKMTLTSEIGGPEKARPIAEEYLRRFPEGSYAGTARALRRVP